MKTIYFLFSLFLVSAMAISQNLVKNGSFEDDYGTSKLPPQWLQHGVDGGGQNNNEAGPLVGENEPTAQDGLKYHRFTNINTNQFANIAQIIQVQPLSHYKLTFYARYFGNAVSTKFDVIIGGFSTELIARNARLTNILPPSLVVAGKTPDIQVPAPYSILGPTAYVDAPTSRDQQWIQHTSYMSTADTVQWLRLNLRKTGAQWYLDNVILEKVDAVPAAVSTLKAESGNFKLENSSVNSTMRIFAQTTGSLVLFDFLGKKIISTNLSVGYNHIMVSNVPKGAYLAKLTDNAGRKIAFRITKK